MPFARIGLAEGTSAGYRRAVGEGVYAAMLDALNVPKDDRFQVIDEPDPENSVIDPSYLGIHRTGECIFIQSPGRGPG